MTKRIRQIGIFLLAFSTSFNLRTSLREKKLWKKAFF